jgi:hypothetical protein
VVPVMDLPVSLSHLEMVMGTRDSDSMSFSSIIRRVYAEFYIHGFISGTNVVLNGFVDPGLIFLNPDSLSVYPDQNY